MNDFDIQVAVKPYVRQYLINNCGNPVDLSHLPRVQDLFRKLLRRPLLRFESLPMPVDSCYVRIVFSKDTFYRYGWEMTRTNMLRFNRVLEQDLKFVMRTYIGSRAALGFTIAQCIRDFQDRFNFPEEIWSYEAIKKDIMRNTEEKRRNDVINFLEEMDQKIHRIFLENLSGTGTISKRYKNELQKI